MAANDLKHMSRKELLELLITQSDEIENLRQQLDEAKNTIKERNIRIQKAGTLAEAALSLNDIFKAADAAAKDYLDNLQHVEEAQNAEIQKAKAEQETMCQKQLEETRRKCEEMLKQAEDECVEIKHRGDAYLRMIVRNAKHVFDEEGRTVSSEDILNDLMQKTTEKN